MIGLSGGIGSGKSTVAAVWRELGATVVDADQVARDVMQLGSPALPALSAAFGEDILYTMVPLTAHFLQSGLLSMQNIPSS
mgnify:CR=1 FL=1